MARDSPNFLRLEFERAGRDDAPAGLFSWSSLRNLHRLRVKRKKDALFELGRLSHVRRTPASSQPAKIQK
jgi:hypothetical protein